MKYYKNSDNTLRMLNDDGSDDYLIVAGTVQITKEEFDILMTPVPVVPKSVTMRQARLVLLGAGLLDTVNTSVSSMPPNVQIEWEYSTAVHRDNALTQSLATLLNLDSAALDSLFTAAAKL